jgi:hypothetical protein
MANIITANTKKGALIFVVRICRPPNLVFCILNSTILPQIDAGCPTHIAPAFGAMWVGFYSAPKTRFQEQNPKKSPSIP